jgi:ABC-type multidrug transport system permease subunit
MGTVLWIAGTLWAALLVYNFITALFGINTFRVKYIELLRWLYRVTHSVTLIMRSSPTPPH